MEGEDQVVSQTLQFKCPHCGGHLEFDPTKQRFKCLYCGQALSADEAEGGKTPAQTAPAEGQARTEAAAYRAYHCQSCGAEVVTTATTAATRCYYCHSPVVMSDRLSGAFRPDGVIPFALDDKGAREVFQSFIRSKKFVDRHFYDQAQMEDFSGIYYPYWLGDLSGRAVFTGEGTRVSVHRDARYTVTTTRHYRVRREGRLTFRKLFRKALSSADRTLSDGIHPYRYEGVKPYAPGYLSGFMAEMRDVEKASAQADMEAEVDDKADGMMRQGHSFDTLIGSTSFQVDQRDLRYVLLPAWVLTYKHRGDGTAYYYMMNGQTGTVCGRLPVHRGKLLAWCGGVAAAVFAIMCLGGAFLW